MPQVAFINYSLETFTPHASGAIATYISECVKALSRTGTDAVVVTRDSPGEMFAVPNLVRVPPPNVAQMQRFDAFPERAWRKATGWPRAGQWSWSRRVLRALERHGLTDAHLVLQNDPELAVYLKRKLPGARVTHLFQNQLPSRAPFRGRFASLIDDVAAVSDFTASWVSDFYAIPRGDVRVVYSAVNTDAFHPEVHDQAGTATIQFVGRTGREKAPDLILRAALILAAARQDFRVRLVGSNHWDRFENDDYQQELAVLVTQLRQRGITVEQPGHIGRVELPAMMANADIHVVPSRWDEPFGLTTLEGMASGCAVVASRTGGTPEVVGEAGILFERDDVEGLAAALNRLLDDRGVLADLGARGRARAETFTWSRTAAALIGPV